MYACAGPLAWTAGRVAYGSWCDVTLPTEGAESGVMEMVRVYDCAPCGCSQVMHHITNIYIVIYSFPASWLLFLNFVLESIKFFLFPITIVVDPPLLTYRS
uniref:Uncharacterized protein n=1 Tax=Trypanosoma congolense (strain IL3000) TaxID=1068625 RepID=G0UUH2_TRYCI|nr:hypothetical protein, unlikely [Trypanosoma congolense IL3000]